MRVLGAWWGAWWERWQWWCSARHGLSREGMTDLLCAVTPPARYAYVLECAGFTAAESARVMGCTLGTQATRLSSAHAQLDQRCVRLARRLTAARVGAAA